MSPILNKYRKNLQRNRHYHINPASHRVFAWIRLHWDYYHWAYLSFTKIVQVERLRIQSQTFFRKSGSIPAQRDLSGSDIWWWNFFNVTVTLSIIQSADPIVPYTIRSSAPTIVQLQCRRFDFNASTVYRFNI